MIQRLAALSAVVWVATASADGKPLGERLLLEVGKGGSVAILATQEGVVATSVDGQRKSVLVADEPVRVLPDERAQVIWFMRYRNPNGFGPMDVSILDLTQAAPKPEIVVEEVPERICVAYQMPNERLGTDCDVILTLEASGPRLSPASKRPAAALAKELKAARISENARARLVKLAERSTDRALYSPNPVAARPAPLTQLKDELCTACGQAQVVPGTKYLAVKVRTQRDFCHLVWQLYDPTTKRFLDAAEKLSEKHPLDGAVFSGAWICKAGDAFVRNGNLYGFDGRKVEGRRGFGSGGGCLGGGWWFEGAEDPKGCH